MNLFAVVHEWGNDLIGMRHNRIRELEEKEELRRTLQREIVEEEIELRKLGERIHELKRVEEEQRRQLLEQREQEIRAFDIRRRQEEQAWLQSQEVESNQRLTLQTSLTPSVVEIQRSMASLRMSHSEAHVAIIGCSGSGKRSLISALTDVREQGSVPRLADSGPVDPSLEDALRSRYFIQCHYHAFGDQDLEAMQNVERFRLQPAIVTRPIILIYSGLFTDRHANVIRNCLVANLRCIIIGTRSDLDNRQIESEVRTELPRLNSQAYEEEIQRRKQQLREDAFRSLNTKIQESFRRVRVAYTPDDRPGMFLINIPSLTNYLRRRVKDQDFGDEEEFLRRLTSDIQMEA